MVPSYSGAAGGRQCSNTYCHAGVKYYSGGVYSPQGSGSTPLWGDPAYLGGSGCGKCHGNPPGGTHNPSTNCNACHNHVAASNIAFTDKTKHINGIVETTVDFCLGCHSTTTACGASDPACVAQKLVGAHISHTDADLFLVGKKLSTGDFTDQSWIYSIKYVKGFPKYGCGFCHPMDSGKHKNGTIELDMDPTHSLAGTVKTKNKAAATNETGATWYTRTTGSSVVCANVYCHSNGYKSGTSYRYKTTPDWYATSPWAAVDKCSQCHGNSPVFAIYSGSPAHARHVVANHYKNIYSNYSGKLAIAGAVGSGAVHGDPATSTTFNCNVCHFSTVKKAFNDKGSICSSCHVAAGSATLKGTMDVYSSNTNHVNGVVDVSFMTPFVIKSKAQVRDSIVTVSQLNTSWTRVNGYKNLSSHDLSRTTPTYTAGTCLTVACHNGTRMEWSTPGPLLCAACHVDLTQ
jgi:predicted CxxxxCH...CXXCH cytochrome family protein